MSTANSLNWQITETLITSVDINSPVAEVDFTNIGSYRTYVLEISNVLTDTTNVSVLLQFDDGLGGYVTTGYYGASVFGDSTGGAFGSWGNAGGPGVNILTWESDAATGVTGYANFKIMGMNQVGVPPAVTGTACTPEFSTPIVWTSTIGGTLPSASNITSFRIIGDSGAIMTQGRFVLYGRDPIVILGP